MSFSCQAYEQLNSRAHIPAPTGPALVHNAKGLIAGGEILKLTGSSIERARARPAHAVYGLCPMLCPRTQPTWDALHIFLAGWCGGRVFAGGSGSLGEPLGAARRRRESHSGVEKRLCRGGPLPCGCRIRRSTLANAS